MIYFDPFCQLLKIFDLHLTKHLHFYHQQAQLLLLLQA